MLRQISFSAVAFLCLSAASPPADPAAAFGAREAVQSIALSPAGSKIAFIAPGPGRSTVLYTVDSKGGTPPVRALVADGKPERLSECGWVSEVRLVCTVYMLIENVLPDSQVVAATRVIALDSDGSKENAGKLQAPVLLFHGELDLNVSMRQSRLMHDRLKEAGKRSELIAYPGLDHQLDDGKARADLLKRSDDFLRAALKL